MRPTTLKQFVGQDKLKKSLEVGIRSATMRGKSLPHTLFVGSAGLGKTTLAFVVANELKVPFVSFVGSGIKEPEELLNILKRLSKNSVLFIDEIHSLDAKLEEILYSAMEDKKINVVYEDGSEGHIWIDDFTLIGATTHYGKLSKPLKSRFGNVFRLRWYNISEMNKIVSLHATGLNLSITNEGRKLIANSCRFTPRLAVNLLINARDYMTIRGGDKITVDDVKKTLHNLGIGKNGINEFDLEYLNLLKKYEKMGLASVASAIGEDKVTVEDEIEPYLLKLGLIMRSASGRVLTERGLKYLGG